VSTPRFAMVTTAALGLSSALNFAALFLWVRLLDPQDFGSYALVSATALMLNAVLFEWLRIVAARTLYDPASPSKIDPARADAILAVTLPMIALLLIAGGLLWAVAGPAAGIQTGWIPLIALFTLSEMALAMVNVVSRVRMEAWQFFQSMVVRSALAIALSLVLVLVFDLGALGIIAGTVIAQLLTAAVIIGRSPVWRGLRVGRRSRAGRDSIREVLTLGAPLIISIGLTFGVGIADRYILNATLGTEAVGYYAATADVLQKTLGFIMLAINITAYPALVRAYEDKGEGAARQLLEGNLVMQMALGLPVVIACIVIAPGLANLFLGPTFRDAGAVLLPWIAAGALVRLLATYHLLMIFQLMRRMKLMLVAPLVTLSIIVPGGIYASTKYGLVGMATAALVAHVVSYAVCALIARRLFAFSLFSRDLLKVAGASALLGVALIPTARIHEPLLVLAICAVAGLAYVLVLLALRLDRAAPIVGWARARLRRA
jgi:O-antigen/teichoic acid export membrane protein